MTSAVCLHSVVVSGALAWLISCVCVCVRACMSLCVERGLHEDRREMSDMKDCITNVWLKVGKVGVMSLSTSDTLHC